MSSALLEADDPPVPLALPVTPRPRWHTTVLFAFCTVGYAVVGYIFTVELNLIDGDGASRVANGAYVTMSLDPHLAAIGFVWNPLPSLVEIPVLQFSHWWPELKTMGLAGTVQSAVFMAGAVITVRAIAIDRGLPAVWRWVAVGAFAVNPMIILYGAIGLSEASALWCTVLSARYLLRWSDTRNPGSLAVAGLALGVCYLTRYEALISMMAGAILVTGVTAWRHRASAHTDAPPSHFAGWRTAIAHGLPDAALFAFPAVVAFTAWALAGWVLTGEAFSQFSSQYGNSSQLAVAAENTTAAGSFTEEFGLMAGRMLGMEPLMMVVLVITIAVAWWRRRPEVLIPIALCGSVLAFQAYAQLTGTTFGWFRFYIMSVPMTIVLVMTLWVPLASRIVGDSRVQRGKVARRSAGALMAAVLLTSVPVTWNSMLNPAVGNQSVQFSLRSIVDPAKYPADQSWYFQMYEDDRNIARFLDNQNLPDGSVISDTFQSWGIWLASERPRQFVITSDANFFLALNDLSGEGIEYVLVSNPAINGGIDAINIRYPAMWSDGAGLAHLVLGVLGPNEIERWRIYRVDQAPAE